MWDCTPHTHYEILLLHYSNCTVNGNWSQALRIPISCCLSSVVHCMRVSHIPLTSTYLWFIIFLLIKAWFNIKSEFTRHYEICTNMVIIIRGPIGIHRVSSEVIQMSQSGGVSQRPRFRDYSCVFIRNTRTWTWTTARTKRKDGGLTADIEHPRQFQTERNDDNLLTSTC